MVRLLHSPQFLWSAFGVIAAVIGVGGYQDDIVTWVGWLSASADWMSGDIGRWVVVAVGVGVVIAANVAPYRKSLPLLNRIDSLLPVATPPIGVEDAPVDVELMLAGLWWHWSRHYYRWTNDPILQLRCPDHHDVTLLMKYKRTLGHSLEKIDWDAIVATRNLSDVDFRNHLYCEVGEHPVLVDAESGSLEELRLRASTAVQAKVRKGTETEEPASQVVELASHDLMSPTSMIKVMKRRVVHWNLEARRPEVDFGITVFNGNVYSVLLRPPTGNLTYKGQQLEVAILPDQKGENRIPRGREDEIKLKQYVPDDLKNEVYDEIKKGRIRMFGWLGIAVPVRCDHADAPEIQMTFGDGDGFIVED